MRLEPKLVSGQAGEIGGRSFDQGEVPRSEAEAIDMRSLLELASDSSAEARKTLVGVISDLFTQKGESLSERERALMTEILRKLISEFELAVRCELATRLAANVNVPQELILLLANDEIEVARPILLQSAVLSDDELIEIIYQRTMEHQLNIAMRRHVSQRVSKALAETDNADVVQALLANPNAQLCEATMQYLVEQSRRFDSYQEPLLERSDLTPELAKRMYWWVSAALRAHIVANFPIDPVELDDEIESVVVQLSDAGVPARDGDASGALSPDARLAEEIGRADLLSPQLLIKLMRQGESALFETLLMRASELERRQVRRVMHDPTGRALVILCRAIGFDRQAFAELYLLRCQGSDRRVRDPRDLARAVKLFGSITVADAQRVVHHWRRNPGYLDAMQQIGNASAG